MEIIFRFNYKLILLLTAIEVLTIPYVAIFHDYINNNIIDIAVIGFFIAFIVVFLILYIIIPYLKKILSNILKCEVISLSNILYICILAGLLLATMFISQLKIIIYTQNDYLIGFLSAFISILITLLLYILIVKIFNYGVVINTKNNSYIITITIMSSLKLTLLFSFYEALVSGPSIIWLNHQSHRFLWGIISGIYTAVVGGVPTLIICKLMNFKLIIKAKKFISN